MKADGSFRQTHEHCSLLWAYHPHVTDRSQFRYRILLVDSDTGFLHDCSEILAKYEVLTATDGFAALCTLRGATPDLLVTELNLPGLSGFELLSIVRTRFPKVAALAVSSEYSPATAPPEMICDAFLAKVPNVQFELVEEVRKLIGESPIRSSPAKTDKAPVWIPRSATGYIVLICPECLRSFSALQPKSGVANNETCLCCGADVPFEMSIFEAPPGPEPSSPQQRSENIRARAERLRADSRELRNKQRF